MVAIRVGPQLSPGIQEGSSKESTCSCAADLLEGDGADCEIDHALATYAEPCAR